MFSWKIFLFAELVVFIEHCNSITLLSNITTEEAINDTISNRFAESYYSITCCRNGFPIPDPSLAPKIKEWTQQMVGSVEYGGNTTCNRYSGRYSIPYEWTANNKDVTVGVRCQCPEDKLDRNCRYLPECQNSGYRSFSINLRCVCPGQYFGELCEKYCLNGNLVKNSNFIDECQCLALFYGDECQKVICFNGGTPVNGRGCSCPMPYVGLHCETRLNGSWDNSIPRNQEALHRNLSGTAISLFLVLTLTLVSIYLIRRRRRLRRAILAASSNQGMVQGYNGNAACPHQLVVDAASFHHSNGGYEVDQYPPLPAYSDVVKSLPPAYHSNDVTPAHSNNNVAMETAAGRSVEHPAPMVQRNSTEGSANVINNL